MRDGGLRLTLAVLLTASSSACMGAIGSGEAGDGATPGDDGAGAAAPASDPVPVELARLTRLQFSNTVRDLFAPIVVPDVDAPQDPTVDAFDNNTAAQTPSPAHIEAYHAAAQTVATAAMADPEALLGCAPTTPADEDACVRAFVQSFGLRAFRGPVSADEEEGLLTLFHTQRDADATFVEASTLVVQAMLEMPRFLYRVEIGSPLDDAEHPEGTTVALDSYEVASRLSYFLWNTMPDDALFDVAAADGLRTAEGVESEARRMLADPRARAAVLRFHRQWLRFDKMQNLAKDEAAFPDFDAATNASLIASAEKQVETAFFDEGSFPSLVTDHTAWVDANIAWIYGVDSSATTLERVPVPHRSGILTHAGLLAGFAHETASSPVLRGVLVLDRFLCAPAPPPPKNVDTSPPDVVPGEVLTTRQRFEQQHENAECAACHHAIHGVGFTFESYDAVGAYRTTEAGLPIDASGWFPESAELSGPVADALAVGDALAGSREAQACVVSHWLRYALGTGKDTIALRQVQPILDRFVASDLDMRELVVSLAAADAFRNRVVALPKEKP